MAESSSKRTVIFASDVCGITTMFVESLIEESRVLVTVRVNSVPSIGAPVDISLAVMIIMFESPGINVNDKALMLTENHWLTKELFMLMTKVSSEVPRLVIMIERFEFPNGDAMMLFSAESTITPILSEICRSRVTLETAQFELKVKVTGKEPADNEGDADSTTSTKSKLLAFNVRDSRPLVTVTPFGRPEIDDDISRFFVPSLLRLSTVSYTHLRAHET